MQWWGNLKHRLHWKEDGNEGRYGWLVEQLRGCLV